MEFLPQCVLSKRKEYTSTGGKNSLLLMEFVMFVSHAFNSCHSRACVFAFPLEIYKFDDFFVVFTGLILLMGIGNILPFSNIQKRLFNTI